MTREEALLKLHEYMRFICGSISEKYYGEALHMAISALQQPDHIADDDKKDDHLRDLTKKVDMISRQAILNKIEKIRQSVQMMDDTHRADIVMSGMNLCEKAVRNQPPAQPEQRWIPVTERLPEVGRYVIATTSWAFVTKAVYFGERWEIDGLDYKRSSVVAWMPLPEPYRKEGEAE